MIISTVASAQPEIADMEAEAASIRQEIAAINMEAEQSVERYNMASVELEGTEQRIAENEKTLVEASARLAEAQKRLNRRLANIYREGSLSMLEVMLGTSSFDEFISRFDLMARISNQDKIDIDVVTSYKAEVQSAREDLESSRARQEELVGILGVEQATIESQLATRQTVLAGVEDEIAQIIAEQEALEQQALEALLAEEAAAMSDDDIEGSSEGLTTSEASAPVAETAAVSGTANTAGTNPYDDVEDVPAGGGNQTPPPSYGGVVEIATWYLGVPYVWGGESPEIGFDCSGLVMYVFAQMGVYLPHSAAAQYYSGTPISYGQLAPGDLVFFGSPISHVGIYIGGGRMIHAPTEGAVVSIDSVNAVGGYSGASRI